MAGGAVVSIQRYPGPGDLPGDSSNPNSPDFDNIAHDEEVEARVEAYADRLVRNGEVAELVECLRCVGGRIMQACSIDRKDGSRDFDMSSLFNRLRDIDESCNP